jgi:phage host-nuclease inhibitor protein Gam
VTAIETWEDDERPEVRQGIWRPDTESDADYCLRRRAEMQAHIDEVARQFEAATARLLARKDELTEREQRGVAWFTSLLTDYAERNRSTLLQGKRKSRDFLHGRIAFRSSAERLEVVDKDALADWLAQQPVESGLYRVEVKPEMKALQDRYRETGEVPPGCGIKPASETVVVESIAPERALTGGKP